MSGGGHPEGLPQGIRQSLHLINGEAGLGDRSKQGHLIKFLGGVPILVIPRGGGSQNHHRRVGYVSGGDAVGKVQYAWSVGHQAYRRGSRDAAEAVGHQRGALLVPDADKFYVLSVVQGVQDVQEGGADDAKNVGNTFLTKHFYHRFAGFHGLGHGHHLPGQTNRIN